MTWAYRHLFDRDPPWNDLCIEHDRAYWQGGSCAARRKADIALLVGVVRNGHPVWAFLMWCAVRLGGHPLLPLPWRWGYGWRWPRPYDL